MAKNFFLDDEEKTPPTKNSNLPKPGYRKRVSGKRGAMSVNGGQAKAGFRKASGKR